MAGSARPGPVPERGFRRDIEGLRGLAILLVVAYHAGIPGFSGGYTGVDVFFVLSGYLITGLLMDEIRSTGRVRFAAFYARRARRLLPAAFTVLIATLLVGRVFYPPVDHRELANTALSTALYVSNLYFARSATDYLAEADANPLLHTWSLAVEEQFYLFWPALVLLGFAGLRSRIRPDRLLWTMVVMGGLSFALCVWLTRSSQPLAFFLLPTRAWEFAIGALARMAPSAASLDSWKTRGLAWLGVLAVLFAGMRFDADTAFPGAAAMIPVAGTALVLASGAINAQAGPFRVLSSSPMQWIGRLSYSWYLWHWPVLIYAHWFRALEGTLPSAGMAVVALGLAALTHVLVENPIRFNRRLAARPWLSLGGAAVLTLIGAGAAGLTRVVGARQAVAPDQIIYTEARELPPIYADGCHLSNFGELVQACEYGSAGSAGSIVLFGDSHAAQWFPPLEQLAQQHQLKLVSLTKSACPAADVDLENQQLGRVYTECMHWRRLAVQRILELRPVAVVISQFSGYIAIPGTSSRWTTSAEEWRAGLERTLATFDSAGIRTVTIADTPFPGFDVPSCLARSAWSPMLHRNRCGFQRMTSRLELAHEIDRSVAGAHANRRFVDLTDTICEAEACNPQADGIVRYRDAHHLTTRFAIRLAPLLSGAILDSATAQ
jgi:peptidoglycan/LPS O-acetylase OafA/YrhL